MSQESIDKKVAEKLTTGRLVSDEGVELEIGTTGVDEAGVKKVLVSLEWLDDLEARLARAERPVLVKAKDLVRDNRRKLVIAGVTVATLGAAAYAATHKDLLLEAVEETSETAELGAQGVKKTARKARTGSTTK
jgi:hypothetical protein